MKEPIINIPLRYFQNNRKLIFTVEKVIVCRTVCAITIGADLNAGDMGTSGTLELIRRRGPGGHVIVMDSIRVTVPIKL